MRVSGRNNAFTPTVGEQINQIISNPGKYPVFESNDDNATVKFSGSAEYYKTYFNSSSFPDDKSLSSDHRNACGGRETRTADDAGKGSSLRSCPFRNHISAFAARQRVTSAPGHRCRAGSCRGG